MRQLELRSAATEICCEESGHMGACLSSVHFALLRLQSQNPSRIAKVVVRREVVVAWPGA
jgi:hypothetical protein